MEYNGITYSYALEFDVPVSYKNTYEHFRVVTTKFHKKIQGFSGLCLENELFVISENKKDEVEAFIDIIDEIVDITVKSIESCVEKHGKIPIPHRKVQDTAFIENFEKCKDSDQSQCYQKLLEMRHLKKYFSNPELITPETYEDFEYNCQKVFLIMIRIPKLKNIKFFDL
jgi:hypothetical protein